MDSKSQFAQRYSMKWMRISIVARHLALIAAWGSLTGCYRYSTLDMRQIDARELNKTPASFRVTTSTGSELSLDSATIRTDSVIGRRNGTRTAIGRADVYRIEERKIDVLKTIRVSSGMVLAVLMILAFSQMGPY
jgi:hypothetical protein